MRPRVCAQCGERFVPRRVDAEVCSDRCRKARSVARIKAEAAFKTNLQIAQNAHAAAYAARKLEVHRSNAATLHIKANHYGVDVRFMGTPPGILAVEKAPGAIPLAVARLDWPGGTMLRMFRETHQTHSKDPELLALVSLSPPMLGGAFILREAESEFRALLQGPQRNASLFEWDVDHFIATDGDPDRFIHMVDPARLPSFDWDEERYRDRHVDGDAEPADHARSVGDDCTVDADDDLDLDGDRDWDLGWDLDAGRDRGGGDRRDG